MKSWLKSKMQSHCWTKLISAEKEKRSFCACGFSLYITLAHKRGYAFAHKPYSFHMTWASSPPPPYFIINARSAKCASDVYKISAIRQKLWRWKLGWLGNDYERSLNLVMASPFQRCKQCCTPVLIHPSTVKWDKACPACQLSLGAWGMSCSLSHACKGCGAGQVCRREGLTLGGISSPLFWDPPSPLRPSSPPAHSGRHARLSGLSEPMDCLYWDSSGPDCPTLKPDPKGAFAQQSDNWSKLCRRSDHH